MKAKVLLIEKKHASLPLFEAGLIRKDYDVTTVKSGSAALSELLESEFDVVVINAASMRTTGKRICQSIHKSDDHSTPVILIVESPFDSLEKVDAEVVLALPFTLQKLINRIRPFEPSDVDNVLRVGKLELDVENRCVRYKEVQTSLTPRLVSLMLILMENPNEVIRREEIFRNVWETDFVDDMRTLDVHISWLRQAIEDDPRRPKLIKTVRGVGYRLVTDAANK